MQDSISANHLHPASFKHSPLPSSKLPSNHSLLKVTQFPTEGFLPFSENSKKILSRVFSQERIDSRQNERIASNLTSSSSKKRLILKNRQKFPSDFFQDSDSKINPELLEKRLTSHAESLVPAISIAHLHQDPLLNQDMLDFIDADQGNIHETPKFSCDNSPILHHEAQYIQEPKYNNLFEICKDRAGTANVLTNSIDNIKKLEFNRIYSALLPNTRGLGNLSERVLNEGPGSMAKKDNLQAKKAHYEAGLSGLLNESNSELGKPVSRVSSQESMYRPIIFYNNELKEKDHPHNGNVSNNAKIRTKRNKQLEEIIALKRRSSEILSKASQSALPKLRNYGEPSNSNISLLKAKAEGFLGLNLSHARKEDRGVKVFDYRLKPTENSTLNTRNTSEGSPLLYNDSFMTKTRQTEESDPFAHLVLTSAKKPGYEVIVHSARKPSGGSTESNGEILSHSDGEEKSGTALRRYTSVENKGGALLSAKELERKLNGRSEGGARNKAKIILHRRHASMQLDHAVLMKYEQKKGIEEKPVRHASAQKIVGKPPSYQGHVNNYFKESPGVKIQVGKVDRIQQSRGASNLRPDTMEIKSRINSKGPKKEYNSAVPEQKVNGRKEQNYSTQTQAQAQNQAPIVEQGENNQNVANKVSTRQRGFTFGKDSKEEEKNKTSKSAIQEDIVIIEDRKESETSYRVETKEDFPTAQDLMQKFV